MRRTLKRTRMPGILAVLLTMSLVAAFSVPAAFADDRARNERPEECKPTGNSDHNDRSGSNKNKDDCDEEGSASQTKGNSEARGDGNGSGRSESQGKSEGRSESQGTGAQTHPPGNNGTVKIDGIPFEHQPNNEPHPGCTFDVDFYGYDEGDLSATVTFTAHPPTSPSGEVVLSESGIFIGEDAAMGGTDLDATRTYTLDLSGYTLHDQQGHHIKLTVNAEGSQGADTKHKVFWVQCVEDTAPDEVDGDREEDEVDGEDTTETDVEEDSVLGTRVERGAPVVVRSETEVAAQEEEADIRGAVLPFTGAALAAFVVLGLGLIGTGAAFVRRRSMR